MGTPAPTSVFLKGLTTSAAKVNFPNVLHGYGTAINSIVSGTTVYVLAAEKLGRTGWLVKGMSTNGGSLWVGIGRDPVVGRDIEIKPGETWVQPAHLVTQDELRIRGTTNDKFFFLEA